MEIRSGYTFCWNGKSEVEDRTHEMGFTFRSFKLFKDIPSLPVSVSKCLVNFWFLLSRSHNMTIISACIPTLTSPNDVKEGF